LLLRKSTGMEDSSSRVMLMWDIDPFHMNTLDDQYTPPDIFTGQTLDPGARNFLFADGHVDCP